MEGHGYASIVQMWGDTEQESPFFPFYYVIEKLNLLNFSVQHFTEIVSPDESIVSAIVRLLVFLKFS